MLLQFSVSNFRSFRKLQTLNLAASSQDKTLPGNCFTHVLPGVSGKQWLKGVAIYGANASGKTTVIQALEALTKLVTTSARMTDPKDPIPQIEPFALRPGEAESPTTFTVVFVADGLRYEYRVAATRERVWHESLRAFPTAKAQVWFCRDWNPESKAYAWSPERPAGFQRDVQLEGYTLSNMLFLSKAIASNRTELEPVFRWFKERLKFLDLSTRSVMGADFTLKQVQEKTALYARIVELLRHADLGVTDARALEQDLPKHIVDHIATLPPETQEQIRKRRWFEPELTHRGKDAAEIPLPWDAESAGTHRFFALAGPWLDILANGYTVFLDELETSMHPVMVMELLRLIFSEKENPKGAQIIFTTHNALLLDITLMRRDQVWFTDKDAEGEGHLYPLTDYAPRKGESLIRGYMSGRYGAVPFLPKGLLGTEPGYEVLDEADVVRETQKTAAPEKKDE
jgi:AAA15 family ATPase/GTPase